MLVVLDKSALLNLLSFFIPGAFLQFQFCFCLTWGIVLLPSKLRWGNLKAAVAWQQGPDSSAIGVKLRVPRSDREEGEEEEGGTWSGTTAISSQLELWVGTRWSSNSVLTRPFSNCQERNWEGYKMNVN